MVIFAKARGKVKELNAKRILQKYRKNENLQWRTLARDISPTQMRIKPRYIKADGTYITYFLAAVARNNERAMPVDMKPGLMDDLMTIRGSAKYTLSVTTAIMRIPQSEAAGILHSAEMMQVGNVYVEKKNDASEYVSADTREDLSETNEIISRVHGNKEVLTYLAFVVTIKAESLEAILEAQGHVTQVFDARLIRSEMPIGKMEQVMRVSMPMSNFPEFAHGNPTTKDAAKLLEAQNVNIATDARGLRLGHRIGEPEQTLTVDLEELPAKHTLVIGGTGTGKTTGMLTYLYRMFTELGYNIVFVTAKADEGTNHRNLAKAAGDDGIVIDIGPGKNSVNPLQIVYTEGNVENNDYAWQEVVHNQIALVTRMLSVYLDETMSPPQRAYVNETMIRLYERRGIHVDRPKTLKKALRDAKYPLFEDLIDLWIEDRKVGGQGDRMKTINALISNTFALSSKGAMSFINNQTDIDTDKKVIVIDVSSINDKKMRDAMNVVTTGIMWQKFRSTRRDHTPTAIATDEAKVFLDDPITRAQILIQLSQARSDGVMCIYMTQQVKDLIKADVGDEFLNNTFIKIVFGPGNDASKAPLVQDFFGFTDQETEEWVKCGRGEAMISIKGVNTPTKIQLTKFELGMIKGTNFKPDEETNQSLVSGSCIDDKVLDLVQDNGLCLADWTTCEGADKYFADMKWVPAKFNSAIGQGTVKAWVHPKLIVEGMVGAQSEDHYATVLQIAAYLLLHGVSDVQVHHTDDVDIEIEINGERIAVEFEKPRSHTRDELMKKQIRASKEYQICYFVGTTDNIAFLRKSVLSENVFSRGVQLRRLLDNLAGDNQNE